MTHDNIAAQIRKLQDEAQELQAQSLAKLMEAAKLGGKDDEARSLMDQMYAVTRSRYANRFGEIDATAPCFFTTAADVDGAQL